MSRTFTLKEWTGHLPLTSCSEVILFSDVVLTFLNSAIGSELALDALNERGCGGTPPHAASATDASPSSCQPKDVNAFDDTDHGRLREFRHSCDEFSASTKRCRG